MKKLIAMLLLFGMLCSMVGCAPDPNAPTIQKSELPQLSAERKAGILELCQYKDFAKDLDFADVYGRKDGIRYYGSYTYESYNGEINTRDYIYIPCDSLPVAMQLDYGGYVFRSRTGFCLYTYETFTYSDGTVFKYLYPLAMPMYRPVQLDETSAQRINNALQLHNAYEYWLHGSIVTEMPTIKPSQELKRVQAVWLLYTGVLYDMQALTTSRSPRYGGTFGGFDFFFQSTVGLAEITYVYAGETFSEGWMVHKDGVFYSLKDAYKDGWVSDEVIKELAQALREQKASRE